MGWGLGNPCCVVWTEVNPAVFSRAYFQENLRANCRIQASACALLLESWMPI